MKLSWSLKIGSVGLDRLSGQLSLSDLKTKYSELQYNQCNHAVWAAWHHKQIIKLSKQDSLLGLILYLLPHMEKSYTHSLNFTVLLIDNSFGDRRQNLIP